MFTKLIRKALSPTFENLLNGERAHLNEIILNMNNALDDIKSSKNFLIEKSIRLNAVINEMENAIADMNSISARDIADNINTYDIASDISIDVDDIQIDYQELGRYVAEVINPVLSVEEADLEVIAHKVVKHLTTNTDYRLWKIERKLDLLLNHHGIGAEDLLVYSNSNEENG